MGLRVNIVGASGYAGGELIRLIASHSGFELGSLVAGGNAGELVTNVHPQFRSLAGVLFDPLIPAEIVECDLLFLALPHGVSGSVVAQFDLARGPKIVDLGADFRLADPLAWEKFYGGDYWGVWTYGLPEFAREEIKNSDRVANPGCYATSISLGLAPVLSLIERDEIVVVAASGTSGAGRLAKVNLLGSEVMGSVSAYKVGGVHQHTPEIEQTLSRLANSPVTLTFTPLLVPMPRGILATITATLAEGVHPSTIRDAFEKAYAKEPFVHVLPRGSQPSTAAVNGSNHVQMGFEVDERLSRLVVTVALDNLVKGAAGQAIQNANLMVGFEESAGLLAEAVAP